ncbi:MAG: hypothetical protein HQ567_20650 [Candidatus Nealsonbacteria bacterium]|nr:hypothetical protein [Candidatus Nealsonbacteria bacterium]
MAETMTGRQRLQTAISGGQADRVPWAPLIDPYFLASLPESFQREHFGATTDQGDTVTEPLYLSDTWRRRVIDFTKHIGADVFQRHAPGLVMRVEDLHIEQSPQGREIVRRHVTRRGVLTDVVYSVPESPNYPFYGKEYKLKTVEDLGVYRYIWENTHFESDYPAFLAEEAYIGDAGLAAIDGPQSAVQLLLGEEAGMSNFYALLQDHPREIEMLIEAMHAKIRQAYHVIAQSPAKVVVAMEDLSSTTSSPAIFERFSWRHLNEYADIVHAEGKTFLAHMCGRLKAMAPLIAQSRLDGVESLTPPSIGDLSVAQARRQWGQRRILIGGLDANLMLQADQQEVRTAVLDVLGQAGDGTHFVLSNADAMPHGARLDTLQTIAEVTQQHGRLPLAGGHN